MQFLRSTVLALIAFIGLVAADAPRTANSDELRPASSLTNPALPERRETSPMLPERQVMTERTTRQEQLLREPAAGRMPFTGERNAAMSTERKEGEEMPREERLEQHRQLVDAEELEMEELVDIDEDEFEVSGFHGGHGHGHGYGKGKAYVPQKKSYTYEKQPVKLVYVETKKAPKFSKKGGYGGY